MHYALYINGSLWKKYKTRQAAENVAMRKVTKAFLQNNPRPDWRIEEAAGDAMLAATGRKS